MTRFALLLSLLFGIAGLFGITAAARAIEIVENIVWIDMRSAREYRRGHIEGAINIPHGDIGQRIFVEVPNTFTEVRIYDGSQGTFAGMALEMLMEIGFQEVVNEGGYEARLTKQGEE
ncbi:MAG: rhodanese-like domain-containing protein [Pseudohongiellaceae bacterium]